MNSQRLTQAIVLTRTDYGEADRILTLLTPDQGKLRLMAKGVRRVKSKLAGGIELFSVTDITYIRGRGDIGTLVSSRLATHYGHIVKDIDRTMLGYELIKRLHKSTEDEPEPEYFELLQQAFESLNTAAISLDVIRTWFSAQLLRLGGHAPNLLRETGGAKLSANQTYEFSFDDGAFRPQPGGSFGADDIKFLRLLFSPNRPVVLAKVSGSEALVLKTQPLVFSMQRQYLPAGAGVA